MQTSETSEAKMATRIKLFVLALISAISAQAQWSFDVASVEAYIADHKSQRSLLLARATLEQSNNLLHEYSAEAAGEYKEINCDLDKYTRAFDVIDLLYQSLRTALNVYETYNTVGDRISDYKKMLEDYNERILKQNKADVEDMRILKISQNAVEMIYAESKFLYSSVTDLVLYATGAAACSTSDLLAIIESINMGLDNIRKHLDRAYFDTWRYIQVRIGYWKESVYRTKTKSEIIDDAFGRWRDSSRNPWNKNGKQ